MTNKQKQRCRIILSWYTNNKRDLPWRKTRNPYRILVAEVMFQQTQVDRVIPKYKVFLRAFPSLKSLAEASTADVIKAWKGLGYNRRALYLQRTAQAICAEYGGRFPQDLDALKTLPGIGDYTARAILSFAFMQPVPMMDTNHRKFYSSLFPRTKGDRALLVKAQTVIDWLTREHEPPSSSPLRGGRSKLVYDWNQAVMDWESRGTRHVTRGKTTKKKSVPFKQADRYFRGRIVDELREKKSVGLIALKKKFEEIDEERFKKIVKGLERDGLIKQSGKRILLPN